MLIIDAHCHAGKGEGVSGTGGKTMPLTNYMKWANEYKITKTVLFSAFHPNYEKANQEVAKIIFSNPARFYGFAWVHAIRDAGRVFSLIKTAIKQYRFCGIKVHRYDARITHEICETARTFSLPVLYDIMGEVSLVYFLAKEYQDVNFIIPHLGSFYDWKAQQSFIDPLRQYPNIYTDSSGVRRFELLKEALDMAGAHKILFGTDWPWCHPGVELEKIYALRTCENDLKLMLAGNFLRMIQKVKFLQNPKEAFGIISPITKKYQSLQP